MNGVVGHDSALEGYTRLGTTWAHEMNFVLSHAPGAGLIAGHVKGKGICLMSRVPFH